MKKFNYWTVIEEDLNPNYPYRKPLCRCVCGKEKRVWQSALNIGVSKSCGCAFKEYLSIQFRKRRLKHGMSRTKNSKGHPLFTVWQSMRRRCKTDNKNYGGRGISVCEEWDKDFMKFYTWSINNGYKKGLQIDRIDNDGNYKPENCRWVTCKVNSRNKRQNRKINGECITDLSRSLDGSNNLVNERIKAGWSIEEAVNKPKRKYTYRVRIKRVAR